MGLISRVSSRTYRKNPKMQLFVQGSSQLSNIEVASEAEFVAFIEKTETELDSITLSVNGVPVESFEELSEGNTVQVSHKLLGGKVHGSLARAKRRMQYNRRFVTES